jgi:hypothetical protein
MIGPYLAVYLSIDWISHGRALKRLDRGRSTSMITFLHSWLPTSQLHGRITLLGDAAHPM